MRPPVERVRVSGRAKDILIKAKRYTGLEHWNEICRIALCRSLANPIPPSKYKIIADSSIDIDWKTFAGVYSNLFISILFLRAKKDGIDMNNKDAISDYFRNHIERGISSLQNIKTIKMIYDK